MFPAIFIHRTAAMALAAVFMAAPVANAKTDCYQLALALRDERDVRLDSGEARDVYDFVCHSEERASSRSSSTSISGSFDMFGFNARGRRNSAEEYREAFCGIGREQTVRMISREIRERATSPEALKAVTECIRKQAGLNLLEISTHKDDTQVVIKLKDEEADERTEAGKRTLQGINSKEFECTANAEPIDEKGRKGKPVILTSNMLTVVCERQGKSKEINNATYTYYPIASLILSLSEDAYTLELPERDVGPVVYEFTDLQKRVGALETESSVLKDRISRPFVDGRSINIVVHSTRQNPASWVNDDRYDVIYPVPPLVHVLNNDLVCDQGYEAVLAWHEIIGSYKLREFLRNKNDMDVAVTDKGMVRLEIPDKRNRDGYVYATVRTVCRLKTE